MATRVEATSRGRALAAFAGALLMFSGAFPAVKASADGFDVLTATALRLAGAAVFLVLAAWRSLPATRGARGRLLLIGAGGMGVQALFFTAGVDAGSASTGGLVLGLEPIGIALLAAVLVGERPTRAQIAGLLLGLTGVAIVSGVFSGGRGDEPPEAIVYLLATMATFSVFTVMVRREAQRMPSSAVLAVTLVGAAMLSVPLALIEIIRGTAVQEDLSAGTLAALTYVVVVSSVGYLLFGYVLARVPAASVAVGLYLLPVLAVLASWLVLGERPGAREVIGGAVILSAVAVAEHGRRAMAVPASGP